MSRVPQRIPFPNVENAAAMSKGSRDTDRVVPCRPARRRRTFRALQFRVSSGTRTLAQAKLVRPLRDCRTQSAWRGGAFRPVV
jgi:hypothetical protein